jgi:hypothetical protein
MTLMEAVDIDALFRCPSARGHPGLARCATLALLTAGEAR